MAARRKKARRTLVKSDKQKWMIVSLIACAGLIFGAVLHLSKGKDKQGSEEAPVAERQVKADSPQQVVTQRPEKAEKNEEQAPREPETEPQKETPPEPPTTPPEEPAQPAPTRQEAKRDTLPEADEKPDEPPPPPAEDTHEEEVTPPPPPRPAAPEKTTPPVPAKPQPTTEDTTPEESYTLIGLDSVAGRKLWSDLVDKMIADENPTQLADELNRKIQSCLPDIITADRFKSSAYLSSPNLLNAVEYCFLVQFVRAEQLRKIILANSEDAQSGAKFMSWLLTDRSRPLHRFLQAFKINSGDTECLPHALNTLYEIWRQTPNDRDRLRYMNLAIACSLIHTNVLAQKSKVRGSTQPPLSIVDVYKHFYTRDVAHRSRVGADLKKMSVSNLLHVVDARLPQSEFDWVHTNIGSVSRKDWGSLYSSIQYLMDNAVNNKDDYTSYTFQEIRKKGGVCREQAYYTAMTAKCVGIPAVIICGDGARGGHAWVALMPTDKAWESVGSYGYNTGYFINPCSGKLQHEYDLTKQDKTMSDDKLAAAADTMLFCEYLLRSKMPGEALQAARYVCLTYPKYVTGWQHRIAIMESLYRDGVLNEKEWKQLHLELERNAGKNSELLDLAQEVDVNHIMINMRDSAKMTALKRGYRKLLRPMTGRVDLLMDCIRRQAQIYVDANDKRGLVVFYKSCLRDHVARGDIYEALITQCISVFGNDDLDYLKTLARDAETIYSKQAYNSPDFFKTKKDSEVMMSIAKMYQKVGDDTRAIKLEKNAEDKLEAAAQKKNQP